MGIPRTPFAWSPGLLDAGARLPSRDSLRSEGLLKPFGRDASVLRIVDDCGTASATGLPSAKGAFDSGRAPPLWLEPPKDF